MSRLRASLAIVMAAVLGGSLLLTPALPTGRTAADSAPVDPARGAAIDPSLKGI